MRRRLRIGAAYDVAVWLTMVRERYRDQRRRLPAPAAPEIEAWHDGMVRYLDSQARNIDYLIAQLPDQFGEIEWDRAAEQTGDVIDMSTSMVDPALAKIAQACDDPERQENDNG